MGAWAVVGGGIHGVHLAVRLVGELGIPASDVTIYDDAPELLARWHAGAQSTGMRYLRSPGVHHLDVDPFSLLQAAGGRRGHGGQLHAPYDRPATELFARHAAGIIARYGLDRRHVQARVTRIDPGPDGVRLETTAGPAVADRVILAPGPHGQPCWPSFAEPFRGDPRVQHVFPHALADDDAARVVVIGGGLSAAQVALRLARPGREVHWVMRHPVRVHLFDSDPGWLGPMFMDEFTRETDPNRRRAMIARARHRGSLPDDVAKAMGAAVQRGSVRRHEAQVEGLDAHGDALTLRTSRGTIGVERVILATGFDPHPPGGEVTAALVRDHGLRVAACGFPVPDAYLRWHPRVFVSGALAELEVGPVSRNIAGARRAGDRLVACVRQLPVVVDAPMLAVAG